MTAVNSNHPRQMVPRWRSWVATVSLGEATQGFNQKYTETSDDIESKILEYNDKADLGRASELLAAAVVYGTVPSQVEKVAIQILEEKTPWILLRDLANRVAYGREEIPEKLSGMDTKANWRNIALSKRILRNNPSNALGWVDLSRHYLTLGQIDQANRSMRVARHLAPQNRFVLRSTAALLWEQDQVELAIEAIKSSESHLRDPGLLAPLIALSDLAKIRPRAIRDAYRLLDDTNLPGKFKAELAAAVGTMEFENGSDRRGRQLFRTSLETPLESVLAQAVWLKDKKKIEFAIDLPAEVERAHEAIARNEAQKLEWSLASSASRDWITDQPFSTQAASFGSWAACEDLDWTTAMDFANHGLQINPTDPILLNNLAFSQVQASQLSEATKTLLRARSTKPEDSDRGALTATEGLVLFRGGYQTLGRERYSAAVEIFAKLKEWDSAADAAIMIALEEVAHGSLYADESVTRARRLAKDVTSPRIREHLERLTTAYDSSIVDAKVSEGIVQDGNGLEVVAPIADEQSR